MTLIALLPLPDDFLNLMMRKHYLLAMRLPWMKVDEASNPHWRVLKHTTFESKPVQTLPCVFQGGSSVPEAGPDGLIKRHDRPKAFLPMNILPRW